MNKALLLTVTTSLTLLTGCFNMPTATSRITGTNISGIEYKNWDCNQLTVEHDHLSERESTLVLAQEQRIKTSKTQGFWTGFGQGDGIEAADLARVRGELTAVKKRMAELGCN